MIEVGEFKLKKGTYNRLIYPSDWRFSASIVGMVNYFDYHDIEYYFDDRKLYYNVENINDQSNELYFLYVENRYNDKMHHRILENILEEKDLNENNKKIVKEKIQANSIMKKTFSKVDINDKELILKLIDENRQKLIEETYKNAKTGYAKYCNSGKFRSDSGEICRLNSYYVDTGRKTNSLSFGFDNSTRSFNDHIEFDFIPFAFTDSREAIFVNNNFSIKLLIKTSKDVKFGIEEDSKSENENYNFRNKLFYTVSEGGDFIDYDVQIIIKEQDKDFYNTLYVRKEAIDIFRRIKELKNFENVKLALNKSFKITDNYYIKIMDSVTESVVNMTTLDALINLLIKNEKGFLTAQLIKINSIIYEAVYSKEGKMSYFGSYKNVQSCAHKVKIEMRKKNSNNKLNSYRYKLISAIVANDNERFIEVMLQLSSYTEIAFPFLHEIIVDWDSNKNLAYDFTNSLNDFTFEKENNENKDGVEDNNEK